MLKSRVWHSHSNYQGDLTNLCTVEKCMCMRTYVFKKCLGNNIVPISCIQLNYTWSQSNFHGILYVLRTNSLFWVFLFWYSAITALDRAPQHSTNPHNRIMLQAFNSQRLFAKAVLMPALIFCRSRIYMQHYYISVKYTSDLQTELQVLNKPVHSQWNQGIIRKVFTPQHSLGGILHVPGHTAYMQTDTSRYCTRLWRKLVFTVL